MSNPYTENTRVQMRKGILEFCILALIGEREVYATDILGSLKQAQLIVVEGTLYPLLNRLKSAGLLSYEWQESSSGPPRKYYKLTPEGHRALKELGGTWEQLNKAIETVRKGSGKGHSSGTARSSKAQNTKAAETATKKRTSVRKK